MEQSPWGGTGGFVDLLCCCYRRDLAEEALGCCFMMFLILVWKCVPISLLITGVVVWSQVWCRSPDISTVGFLSFCSTGALCSYRGGNSSGIQAHQSVLSCLYSCLHLSVNIITGVHSFISPSATLTGGGLGSATGNFPFPM